MEIMLDTITAISKELSLFCTPEELDLKLDLATLPSNVDYVLTARRVEDEVFLDGTLNFVIHFTCARCLEEFDASYHLPLNLVIQLVSDEAIKTEEEDRDQFVVFPGSKKVYNLDQHVRDLITLELPMKPLCRPECAGLCPKCGANLNESACQCNLKESDPRWEALRKLHQ